MELHQLSALEAAALIRQREISPVELVEALLRRIDALEPDIQAWETVDRKGALESARRCEAEAGRGDVGPLHGVPVGIKDIIHVEGLPTTNGSSIFKDYMPGYDATSVARLREAGAVMLGKTVTVQFAQGGDPVRTRNPWNFDRTPGGSSSGSGAAVAARMVPATLGTQTGGSVLRPAAYCGVMGLKPSQGRISRHGLTPASWNLDHVGILVRTVEDAALLLRVVAGRDPRDPSSSTLPVANYLEAARERDRAPRLGLITDYPGYAQPEVAAHLKEVAGRFERAGAEVREVRLPLPLPDLLAIHLVINRVDASTVHAQLVGEHPEGYLRRIRMRMEVGQLVPGVFYLHALRLRRRLRPRMVEMFQGVDCLLLPTVSNVAPDTSTTGDASFQAVWALFGLPSITLPSGLSGERLPLGTQLVAPGFRENVLLRAAAWCEKVLGPMPSPID